MKTAILIHGTGGSDKDYFWFSSIKNYLESYGYTVAWPLLPNTDNPNLSETRAALEDIMPYDPESIIIGHSSACPVILHMLQYYQTAVKQVVLVAGFYESIDDTGFSAQMLQSEPFDYQAIKNAAQQMVLINSDDDPWGCNDKQAQPVANALGAKFILAENQGHMGSLSFGQPYREFKLLENLLSV